MASPNPVPPEPHPHGSGAGLSWGMGVTVRMDPILDEMRRVKDPADIKSSRFRDWCDHFGRVLAERDMAQAELAAMKATVRKRGPDVA